MSRTFEKEYADYLIGRRQISYDEYLSLREAFGLQSWQTAVAKSYLERLKKDSNRSTKDIEELRGMVIDLQKRNKKLHTDMISWKKLYENRETLTDAPPAKCPTRAEAEAKFRELVNQESGNRSVALDFRDWILPQLPQLPEGEHPQGSDIRIIQDPETFISHHTSEPIATPETLEALATVGRKKWREVFGQEQIPEESSWEMIVTAILRAAQAYVEVSLIEMLRIFRAALTNTQHKNINEVNAMKHVLSHMNSRIRYRVAVPPETPKGLPGVDRVWKMITSIVDELSDSDGNDYVELGRTDVSDLIVALRPWLRDPLGWELDVTVEELEEARDKYTHSEYNTPNWEMLQWLRSRIRPTFECAECAIASQSISDLQTELDHVKTNLTECEQRIDEARVALEGE